ncbi:IclR family transcriptional regulator [Nonomuraea turkmeniaca]|uniref:IclR family transcriptional regulator n=1 Tax=Nonomuraea turkmeniaca TaxID=103838 RepID=A0A5S4FJR5_9ACTN|nr:IclR family transcriptional regulator [Nonomuraea turkmeniaca]TMR20734.1 IclR family transcriptional regulator [Nonomuraea turkmeniaca]
MIPVRQAAGEVGSGRMQTLVRALRVLRLLSEDPAGMTLQEISDRLDIPLASTYRLLSTMVQEEFVVRTSRTRRYFAGPGALALGEAARREDRLRHTPPPLLAQAAITAGETAFVTELVDDRAICVAIAEGRRPLRLFVRLGQEMPLHAAAAARVLLVDREEDDVLELLGPSLPRFTSDTLCSHQAVLDHLKEVRALGYDTCVGELDEGVRAVSSAIRDAEGQVRQSLTVAGPAQRMRHPANWNLVVKVVRETSAALSADLGGLE